MKRSRSIRLVLLSGLSAGALSGGQASAVNPPAVSTGAVFTNDFHIPGAGYYHAPFRAWYPLPYNYFDPQTRRYYYGGQWGPEPHQTITNISAPTVQAVQQVAAVRTDTIRRGGFGTSSRSHYVVT